MFHKIVNFHQNIIEKYLYNLGNIVGFQEWTHILAANFTSVAVHKSFGKIITIKQCKLL